MKLAAALILSFAVFAVVMAQSQNMENKKMPKIPDEETEDLSPPQTMPEGTSMGLGSPILEALGKATRRGGKGGKGESSPPPQGWGWGGPPQHGGWGPPAGGWGPPPQPMVIPIPISVYRHGGYGGGYGGGY